MLRHVTSCHVMSRYATSEIQIKIDVQKGADTHTASAVYNLVIYIICISYFRKLILFFGFTFVCFYIVQSILQLWKINIELFFTREWLVNEGTKIEGTFWWVCHLTNMCHLARIFVCHFAHIVYVVWPSWCRQNDTAMYFFQGQLPSKRCTILPLFQFKIIEYIAIYRTYKIYCNRMITKASIFKSPLGMSFTTPFPYMNYGTETEIQLPLKRFSDSSVSSLIQTGWCGRASHHQKLAPIPMGG